ncbi:MAG: phosphoserine phosphatase SerB [Pseudomonadota bacterium]
MATIIVQGGATAQMVEKMLDVLGGELVTRHGYWRIHTRKTPTHQTIRELRNKYPIDINLLPRDFDSHQVRLVLTDMDSTLINIECIDEIADFANVKPQVAAITGAAMRGELDFKASLTQRVALLEGLSADVLERVYTERLKLNPGTEALIAGLKLHHIRVALVSGGFTFFTQRLHQRLGLDFSRANVLEVVEGKLTGRIADGIIGAQEKAEFLLQVCAELGITPQQAIAVGDGANDLLMMHEAGVGVAYRAKPKVQAEACCVLNHVGLDGILGLLEIDQARR